MAKFEIFNGSNSEYYFRLKASNGEIILSSEGYTQKHNCENGIESVKGNSPYDSRYSRLTASNGQPYFTLNSTNRQVIGTSEMYSSNQMRDKGIESVKNNAPTAIIDDLT